METNNERISLFHPSFHVLTVFGLVLATEIVAKLISKFAASNEAVARELRELRLQMRKIRLEAEPLNNPATFAKFSKLQRELNKLSAREQVILNSEPPPPTTSETILKWMPTVTKVLAYAALAFFFWSTPLFAMPDGSWLLSKLQVIAPPAAAITWPVDSVGVLPWLFVARQLAAISVNKLFPPPPPPKFSFM